MSCGRSRVTFNPDAKLDPSQVEDRRASGSAGGGPIMVGGGAVGLIILIAALLLGVDPTGLIDTTSQPPIEGVQSVQECRTGADANKRDDCRVVGFVDSVQKYWSDEFNRRGSTYSPAATVIFTGYAEAACGTASAATGPFYCPNDQKVYLDISFFQELQSRFGAKGGPFAEGYVIAHEYGHHVQDELGLLKQSSSAKASVRVEHRIPEAPDRRGDRAGARCGRRRRRRSHPAADARPRDAGELDARLIRAASVLV